MSRAHTPRPPLPGPPALPALPTWARAFLALVPLGDRRTETSSDLAELFADRRERYGPAHAHGRLLTDALSLWRGRARGGMMRQDLRFALRLCRRHPAPIAVAIVGLALAIGVVTAAFSIVNAMMLRPYGMDDPSSVVRVARLDHGDRPFPYWAYSHFLRMREAGPSATLEASMLEKAQLSATNADDTAPSQFVQFVSGGYLETFGGRPVLGRPLGPDDDAPDAAPVLVVSHHVWTTALGADPAVVGRIVWLNGLPMTLVGVLAPGFSGPEELRPAIWLPITLYDEVEGGPEIAPTSNTQFEVVARLAPGARRQAVEEHLTAVVNAPTGENATPPDRTRIVGLVSATSPFDEADNEDVIVLAAVFAILGLVLTLACANTANLLLAGATTRMREIGVRLALGATGRRLLLQMASESVLLGLVAGGAGYLVAFLLAPIFASTIAVSPEIDVAPDARVLLFTLFVAGACGLGAGLAPARFASRGSVLTVLRSQGRSSEGPPVRATRRSWFVGFQAAVSMLLLVIAGLLTRTAVHAAGTDVGLDIDRLFSVHLQMPRADFDERGYLQRALEAVREIPAVQAVSLTQHPPFGMSVNTLSLDAIGRGTYELHQHRTDADYFAVSGTRVVHGRAFSEAEVNAEAPVALVSEGVARRFFGDRDPIGQPLSVIPFANPQPHAVIIGVTADAVTSSFQALAVGTLYRPLAGERPNPPGILVRAANPGVAMHAVGEALRRLDARVRPSTTISRDRFDSFLGNKRMVAWLMGPIAGLALVLATLGIFGVTAFVVGQRRHEVSVRMAIGASARDVLHLLGTQSLRPVVIGLGVGLLMALGLARVLATLLSGISPYDPVAVGVAATALLGSAIVAVLVPVRRAARTDPASVLRDA